MRHLAREDFSQKLRHMSVPLRKILTYNRGERWPNTSGWPRARDQDLRYGFLQSV